MVVIIKFHINNNVRSVAEPVRPIPFYLYFKARFKKEIDIMKKAGIIKEHSGPAPWVSWISQR